MVSTKKHKIRILDGRQNKGIEENISSCSSFVDNQKEEEKSKKEIEIGLDISSSCTGVCVLEKGTNNLLELFPVKLTSVKYDNNMFLKCEEIQKIFENMNKKYIVTDVYVEDCAKKFSAGKSSAETIVVLAKMNATVCWIAYQVFGIEPKFINVRTGRKILGIKIDTKDKTKSTKEKVFEKVLVLNPNFPWTKHIAKTGKFKDEEVYDKVNQDAADAWVICRSGQYKIFT